MDSWTSGYLLHHRGFQTGRIFENEYQNRQGRPVDAIWGLESDGLFESSEDIANSPESAFGAVQPGDIKYIDQNEDGVINAQDEVYLGRGGWSDLLLPGS